MTEDGGKKPGIVKRNVFSRLLTVFLCFPITVYRYTLSRFLGGQCRFLPTCSAYAQEALRTHGPVKGLGLTFRRVCRCHPWGGHGYDPVPKEAFRDQ